MAARAISAATISFGLVSIPIKLYTTSESGSSISFNMLHECGTRLKQQYICPKDDVVVPRDEMVKGYEFAKGQYVTFTEDELKALEAEGSRMIEIHEFIPVAEVDPLYFDRPYYLGPDKGGDKPYKLLARAMQETGRCALASYAVRGKQYLVLLRPFEDGLVMHLDNDKQNNRLVNLQMGTSQGNATGKKPVTVHIRREDGTMDTTTYESERDAARLTGICHQTINRKRQRPGSPPSVFATTRNGIKFAATTPFSAAEETEPPGEFGM